MKVIPVSFFVPKIQKTGNKYMSEVAFGNSDKTTNGGNRQLPEKQPNYSYGNTINQYSDKGRVEVKKSKNRSGNPIETHVKYRTGNIKQREAVYAVDGDKRYLVSLMHYDELGDNIKTIRPSGNGGAVVLELDKEKGEWNSRELSTIHYERLSYQPKLAGVLQGGINNITTQQINGPTTAAKDAEEVEKHFPITYGQPLVQTIPMYSEFPLRQIPAPKKRNVGVILSGGPAPGGHNVIAGLYDALKEANPDSKLYGFKEGVKGLTKGNSMEITDVVIDEYRNTGGFDLLKASREKLEGNKFDKVLENCKALDIDTIVIVGGDDSNTNTGLLAEWMKAHNAGIQVIGCPKTIDGDLQNEHIEMSFGFGTATKTYAELVGNLQRDASSAGKYTNFVRLMGRSASHIVLEVALRAHPNVALISEEIEAKNMSLDDIVDDIVDVIAARSEGKDDNGEKKNYSVILVPEGLLEFIPEVKRMNSSLSDILDIVSKDETFNKKSDKERFEIVKSQMSKEDAKVFDKFPDPIKNQLLLPKDDHGNTQVAKIETEKLLIDLVGQKLEKLAVEGKYKGKFSPLAHYLGYEGRSAFPSNFDADYCYSLGYNAFALAQAGLTGYMSCIKGLTRPAENWQAGGVPITSMMNIEKRHGEYVPVIQKAMVDLEGSAFKMYKNEQPHRWALKDNYKFPSGVQFFGPDSVCNKPSLTQMYSDIPETDCNLLIPKNILEASSRSFQTDEKLGRRVIKTVTPDGREFVTTTTACKEDGKRIKSKTYEIVDGEYILRSEAKYDGSGKTIIFSQVEKEGGFHYIDFPKGEWVIVDEVGNNHERRDAEEYVEALNSGEINTLAM